MVRVRIAKAVIALGASLALVACDEENVYVPPPPPQVTVATPLIEDVTEYLEFTGTTVASSHVEVRARVSGVLERVHFEPGTFVQAGDPLFSIDPAEYEAAVQAAHAELASAQARLAAADQAVQRARTLIQRGNISQAQLDEAEADFASARAEVLRREADLTRAQLDLGYTEVTAPASGRIGRSLVDPGNLVGRGEATLLTDITAYNPIYAYFEVNERDLLRILERERQAEAPPRAAGRRKPVAVELGLANQTGYPFLGYTDFAASQLDPDTGTLLVRAVFENGGATPALLPGLFARVRMPIAERPGMPLVAEPAIGFDQSGRYLMVVDDDGVVEKRNVELGPLVGGLRVIDAGIDTDDRVVVRGVQRARDGAKVQAQEAEMIALGSPETSPSAEAQEAEPEAAGNAAAAGGVAPPQPPAD